MDIEYFIKNWKNIEEEDISFSEDEWGKISIHRFLSEDFIERYKDKVDWDYISAYQKLSEEFIEKYENKVNWYRISRYQFLSEEFIERHGDRLDWYYISYYQKLSEEFIYKHKDQISHHNCLEKHYRLRHMHSNFLLSIHANNNYSIILQWKDFGFYLLTIPANIIFCHTL